MNAMSLLFSPSMLTRSFALVWLAMALLLSLASAGFRRINGIAKSDRIIMSTLKQSQNHSALSYVLALTGLLLVSFSAIAKNDEANNATNSTTNNIRIDESFQHILVNHHSSITYAPDSATYFDVLEGASAFSGQQITSTNSRQWLSTDIQHSGFSPVSLVVNVDRLNIDDLQLYLLNNNERIIKTYRYQAGKGDLSLPQPVPSIRLSFTLQPYQNVRLLIGIKDAGLSNIPVTLWERDALEQYDTNMLVALGAVLGVFALIITYFLLSYFNQRIAIRFWLTMSSLAMLTLFFIFQSGLGVWPSLTNTTEAAFIIASTLLVLCFAKVTHHLFPRVPAFLKALNFAIPFACLYCFFIEPTVAIVVLLSTIAAMGVSQVALALTFKENRQTSRLFSIGWLSFFVLFAISIQGLYHFMVYTFSVYLVMLFFAAFGLLCLGMAAATKERFYNKKQLVKKEEIITNLNHFYHLFRNSAEGHYTSTWDGNLVSVNPAMYKLFGYTDEDDMLETGAKTSVFYANADDRQLLLGELSQTGHLTGKEIRAKRKNGEEFWISLSCRLQENGDGPYIFGSIIDITEKKQSDLNLRYLATHDSLTGTYNRRQFESEFKSKVASVSRPVCLLYLDLDRFKVVNDTCGHKAGDVLIKDIARLIENTLLKNALLARLGGDEFGIIYSDYDEKRVFENAEKILNAVQDYRFMWNNRIFNLGVSIGMVVCDENTTSAGQYLRMADAACYFAKDQGRNQIHRYNSNEESTQRYQRELDWVSTINNALEENRFELYYQPLRPLSQANEGYYYEVLLRLRESDGNIVEPANFLPTAERFEMNVNVDKWVVTNTFKWLSENPEHLSNLKRCSINLNCHSLADRDFTLFILNAFETFGIAYNKICFEVIESVAIIKMDDTLAFMQTFKNLGCTFSLDDFGSGFSSYNYLKSLPVDQVKIDGMFIKDMLNDSVDTAMVASIKDVAKAMGMQTVAEFVENEATMTQLGNMGIDFAQGYGVAVPAPLVDFIPL